MLNLANETAFTLSKQIAYWQKHKPRAKNKEILFEYCLELSKRVVAKSNLPPWTPQEIDDFIIYVAEEMYFTVCNRDDIGNYFSYFRKCIIGLIGDWCKLESKEMNMYNDKANIYHNPGAALRYTPFDLEAAFDKDFTADLVKRLCTDVQQCIRYSRVYTNGVSRLNARISMSLSIKYGRFVSFRQSEEDAAATRYLYNKFRLAFQKLVNETHQCVLSDEHYLAYIACQIRGDFDDDKEA